MRKEKSFPSTRHRHIYASLWMCTQEKESYLSGSFLSSYLQSPLWQLKTPQHKAPIVRKAWRARWGSGVSLSRCHSSVAFLSLLLGYTFSTAKYFTRTELQSDPCAYSQSPLPLQPPIPLFSTFFPQIPSFLPAIEQWKEAGTLGAGGAGPLWWGGGEEFCVPVYMWKEEGGWRAVLGQETAPSRWWNWSFICLRAGVGWRGPCSVRRNPQTHSIRSPWAHLWMALKGEWAPGESVQCSHGITGLCWCSTVEGSTVHAKCCLQKLGQYWVLNLILLVPRFFF